jgi:hypothetical protein
MLEIRPVCENCAIALPPESVTAMICSFECTFCKTCVDEVLHNVCPNCGGGFSSRPVRPSTNWRGDNYLTSHPATSELRHHPVDTRDHDIFSATIRLVPPEQR